MDLILWLLWSLRGQPPAHETRFLAVGKADISAPTSESTWIAVSGFLSNSDMVRIRSRTLSYLLLRRKISRSISDLWDSNSSMWARHCLSFTACSSEMASSTVSCISGVGVLHLPSTNAATSKISPGGSKICAIIERDDLPNISEKHHLALNLI